MPSRLFTYDNKVVVLLLCYVVTFVDIGNQFCCLCKHFQLQVFPKDCLFGHPSVLMWTIHMSRAIVRKNGDPDHAGGLTLTASCSYMPSGGKTGFPAKINRKP